MSSLIDLVHKEAAKKLADRQFFWEAAKALAGILAAVAVLTGAILALSNWLAAADVSTWDGDHDTRRTREMTWDQISRRL